MSVVVGLIEGGEVYMAADSAVCSLDRSWIREDRESKIFRAGSILIGVVGSARVGDILAQTFCHKDLSGFQNAEAIREVLKAAGAVKTQYGLETMDAEILIASKDGLTHIVNNFGYVTPKENYHAIGAGAQYALGALYSGSFSAPKYRIEIAIEAASHLSPYVTGPVKMLKISENPATFMSRTKPDSIHKQMCGQIFATSAYRFTPTLEKLTHWVKIVDGEYEWCEKMWEADGSFVGTTTVGGIECVVIDTAKPVLPMRPPTSTRFREL